MISDDFSLFNLHDRCVLHRALSPGPFPKVASTILTTSDFTLDDLKINLLKQIPKFKVKGGKNESKR
jgi:hypothetical protein